MEEEQPFYRDPKKQIILAVVAVAILYLYLLGRQGAALDVAVGNGYAYLAMGASGGVRVVDVRDPVAPNEIGHYSFLGSAKSVTLADKYLLVANGDRGMRILNVSDPTAPDLVSTFSTVGNTRDITVSGHYAYLAKGEAGITIVDFSDPTHPVGVKNIPLPGSSNAVESLQVTTTLPPPADSQTPIEKKSIYLYVANGARGVQVIDVSLPTAPVVMGGVDTSGEAVDIALSGPYAYVADSLSGLRVESIANPVQPVEIGHMDTDGPALRVSVDGPYVLVAKGTDGLSVVNVANPNVSVEAMNYSAAGNVLSAAGLGPYVLMAEGQQGMLIANIGNAARPVVVSNYDTPGEATIIQVLQGIWTAFKDGPDLVHPKVWRTLLIILGDLVLLGIIILFWLGFFAQFSLPLHTIHDRLKAFQLMVSYYMGKRGPALFIENGKLVERSRESARFGPGVAIMDTASAAVFRTRHAFTRPAGPGIIFTNPAEYPAGVVDLHQQSVSLGPVEKEGKKSDPFSPQAEGEDDQQYRERQEHRYATSGTTRDGVEVVPNISVTFKLDSAPGEGKTRFGYNPQAVWKAIAGVGVQPNADPGSGERFVSWPWLTGHISVDLWREYLRKFTLDELFAYSQSPNPGHNSRRKTAFDVISEMVKARMTREEVEELDENGKPTGKKVHSREFDLLKDRGIKILSVGIRSLRFPAEVEKQLVDQWVGTWLQRAQEDVRQADQAQSEERNNGLELALKDYAAACSQNLANVLANDLTVGMTPSLEHLVRGTLKLSIREIELNPRLTNQKTNLVELLDWIRKE